MKTTLCEAMTSGVFVDFRDAEGHSVGQAVYTDWRSRPVPAVGDTMCCVMWIAASGRKQKVHGRVCSRHFEVQREPNGQPSVWAQLVLEKIDAPRQASSPGASARSSRFSRN
jgi:hypothetical protein